METNWLYEPREYKFRGKSEEDDTWIYGDLAITEEEVLPESDDTPEDSGDEEPVISETDSGDGDSEGKPSEEEPTDSDAESDSDDSGTDSEGGDSEEISDESSGDGSDSGDDSSEETTSDTEITTVTKYRINGVEIKKDTIGVYLGITDKEGNEIYEGDIIQIGDENSYGIIVWNNTDPVSYIIKYIKFNGEFTDNKNALLYKKYQDTYLVIGNIFDTPELIPISEFPLPRALLFRGQHLGVWYVGDMYRSGQYVYIKTDSETLLVNPRTICQYTGFSDANNIDIYENDIVEMSITAIEYSPMARLKVVWDKNESSFVLYRLSGGIEVKYVNLDSDVVPYLRIIGNTFDSPERFK